LVVAGPPYSVVLGRAPEPESNGDGTYTHRYFALVADQYGNAVPDGTAVYFGHVYNVEDSGSDGRLYEATDTFDTASSVNFETAGVVAGDTLLIEDGVAEGGYIVEAVSGTTLTLFADIREDLTGLQYRVGNSLGGGEITPLAATKGGVATAEMKYPVPLIKDPVWVYAETSGRTVGDVREFLLSWPRPTAVTIVGPSDAIAGRDYPITVIVEDAASPPNRLEGVVLSIEDTTGWFDIGTTDENGEYVTTWTAPGEVTSIIVTAEDGTQKTLGPFEGTTSTVITLIGLSTVNTSEANTYSAYLQDADGAPLVGETVTISAEDGALDKNSDTTDAIGKIDFVWTAPATPGTYKLTVTAADGTTKTRSVIVE
ncbi:Ig-like domain-containing protein, partial [Deferrisoma sp.]